MAYLRTVLTDNHPTLRKIAKRIQRTELADPLFQQLIDDMFETMDAALGIGLAAPQIGVSKRLFVIDLQDDDPNHGPFVLINPKFTVTEGEVVATEGCLSVPGLIGDVKRFERVVCSALDRYGNKVEFEGTELFGRCLQHEMDHLDGILYIDKAENLRPAETKEEREVLATVDAEGEALEDLRRRRNPDEFSARKTMLA
ncbi:MAG TPA: peptide deformylase [Candidatus Baltobacteraceae bacterium]|jgi:peptide deformylase|nr:peptide deformylase [Candidatus Baltobacteraceae bacterium]